MPQSEMITWEGKKNHLHIEKKKKKKTDSGPDAPKGQSAPVSF